LDLVGGDTHFFFCFHRPVRRSVEADVQLTAVIGIDLTLLESLGNYSLNRNIFKTLNIQQNISLAKLAFVYVIKLFMVSAISN